MGVAKHYSPGFWLHKIAQNGNFSSFCRAFQEVCASSVGIGGVSYIDVYIYILIYIHIMVQVNWISLYANLCAQIE